MRMFTRTNRKDTQKGQAIVLIALLILVLFGMLGLAIDSGRAYVDRRDQQAAVDAAALAAGDWYENYVDLYGSTLPNAKAVYQADLHLYAGPTSDTDVTTFVGQGNSLQQDTDTVTYANGYTLTIVATNTQFNGYQFVFSSSHQLPLAFMQLFGGSPNITINATATAVVGNQRQTPALLTLSNGACALNLKGAGTLTLLGDAYSNGTACVDPNLQEAGNCYAAAGSNCSSATYYCYNATPGFVPYPPPCNPGDIQGQPVVPAPTLPDPGYLAPSEPVYAALPVQPTYGLSRGTWSEMFPGNYGFFHPAGGFGCAFLDPGVYVWDGGYKDDANGSLISNMLKPPSEELYTAPATSNVASMQFWNQNGANCAGNFSISVVSGLGANGLAHKAGNGFWGVELTSVRWDTFLDPAFSPDPCLASPGCRRESAPSECVQTPSVLDSAGIGINVSITVNSPGAQYYNVYVNPQGCDGNQSDFSFYDRFLAPGWNDAGAPPAFAVGPYPNGGAGTVLTNGKGGWLCPAAGVTICKTSAFNIPPNVAGSNCYSNTRFTGCYPPDDEIAPRCFSGCPAPGLSQEDAPWQLQYAPYSGGDEANENYCQQPAAAGTGDPNQPCANAKITPGAVQFYFPAGACLDQESQGATYVFAGEQYNWISIYMPPANNCNNSMNGGSATQYIGTIYTPGANWSINGGNRAPLAGQVICYTASVTGAAAVGIDFNPNYSPAPPAARLIN